MLEHWRFQLSHPSLLPRKHPRHHLPHRPANFLGRGSIRSRVGLCPEWSQWDELPL